MAASAAAVLNFHGVRLPLMFRSSCEFARGIGRLIVFPNLILCFVFVALQGIYIFTELLY